MGNRVPVIRGRFYAAPTPVLRLWLYLVQRRRTGYRGTLGLLYDEIRDEGGSVSRRSLGQGLKMLESVGMISRSSQGSYLEIDITEEATV